MKQISDTGADRLQKILGEPDLAETKYRLLRKLGSGGMAEGYLVHDTELDRQAALKVIDALQFRDDVGARMWEEAKGSACFEQAAVVSVHAVGVLPDGGGYD